MNLILFLKREKTYQILDKRLKSGGILSTHSDIKSVKKSQENSIRKVFEAINELANGC